MPPFVLAAGLAVKVALCTPCYDGRVHDAHMVSVSQTMMAGAARGIEIVHILGRGSPVLPDVRNWCVAQALSARCDKIWFVDSDIAWQSSISETLNMLLAPVDIVCGVHQKRNSLWNDPPDLVVRWKQIPPIAEAETGLWEVDSVATAFVCIDRSVFERIDAAGLARKYLPHAKEGVDLSWCQHNRNYFWYGFTEAASSRPDGYDGPMEIIQGEDFYFCDIAKRAGCQIFVDPRIELTHFDGCVQHNASLKNVQFVRSDDTSASISDSARAA